jgi:FAD/FMN-containing dehydrogenase
MTSTSQVSSRPAGDEVADLASRLQGNLFQPGDPGFDVEAAAFNLATAHRPQLIVAAGGTADVAAAVSFASRHGLPVAVQATGHGADVAVDTGVFINTRHLAGVRVDPQARTATVGAGVKWAAVIEAAAPYGLAPLNGSSSDVGAVGYTVGGGVPVLGRTFGFAADHVRRMTVVTADGASRDVAADREAVLFWGLRGGKGNLGVVTEMTIDLMPVARLYGGAIFYPGEHAAAVLHAYREWIATLGEATNTSIALLRLPPLPDVPEPLRGRFVVSLRVAHVGEPVDGIRLVAPMRSAAPVLIDAIGDMPYAAVDSIHRDPEHPLPFCLCSTALRDFGADAVDRLLAVAGPQAQTPVLMVEVRHLGGAFARPAAVPNAVGGRDAGFSLLALGVLAPPVVDVVPAALESVVAALKPFSTGGTLLNLHGKPGDAADRSRPWPADIYRRLCELKAAYDPQNLFRFGHAITPTRP